MAEDRQVTERRDRLDRVEASEARRHLDVMNLAAPIPSDTPYTATPEQGTDAQGAIANNTPPPPDYDG
jgi:hypothetical protein